MEFNDLVTKDDIADIIVSAMSGKLYNNAIHSGRIDFEIDDDYTPHVIYIPNRSDISVEFTTNDILDKWGSVIGFDFDGVISTPSSLANADDSVDKFEEWAFVARVVKGISELQIFPYHYFD